MTPKQTHRHLIRHTAGYLRLIDPPGCFAEFGVKQGSSAAIMASVLKKKQGYLFDTWKGFPSFGKEDMPDRFSRGYLRVKMKCAKNTQNDCVDNLRGNGVLDRCKMIKGDICETVPKFFKKNSDKKFCMVHIDTDLYAPAKTSLECVWPHMVDGGLVFVHDYGSNKWPGIKKLIDEFVKTQDVSVYNSFSIPSILLAKSGDYDFSEYHYKLIGTLP